MIVGTLALVAIGSLMTACVPLFPTRPSRVGPISLTVIDGHFAYVTCFREDVEATYLYMGVESQKKSVTLLGGENPDSEVFTIHPGETLSSDAPPEGLAIFDQTSVPASYFSEGDASVSISISGPNTLTEMVFKNVDATKISDGKYLYHSGEIRDKPCEMVKDAPK